jgi:hypothetical protein
MKKIKIKIKMEIPCPNCKTIEEAIEYAENYELPKGYMEDSFEIIEITEDQKNK